MLSIDTVIDVGIGSSTFAVNTNASLSYGYNAKIRGIAIIQLILVGARCVKRHIASRSVRSGLEHKTSTKRHGAG